MSTTPTSIPGLPSGTAAWVNIGLAVLPELVEIGKMVANLIQKHPELTPEQVLAALLSITSHADAEVDAAVAEWAAVDAAKKKT